MYSKSLFRVILKLLKEQGCLEDYLCLAQMVDLKDLYLLMLIEQGDIDTAVQVGLQELDSYSDTLTVAQKLAEIGHQAAALQLTRHILATPYTDESTINHYSKLVRLADWTYELAREREPQTSLQAAILACRHLPNVERYQRVQTAAGTQWAQSRQELLKYLSKKRQSSPGYIEILLQEGMVKEAIKQIDSFSGTHSPLLKRVMEAARQVQPNWVIETAKQLAEDIMNADKSYRYAEAVNWLTQVQAAYQASHRLTEWQSYYMNLRTVYQRKWRLLQLLEEAFEV